VSWTKHCRFPNHLCHCSFSGPRRVFCRCSVVVFKHGSSSREEIEEVFAALDADLDRLCGLSFEALTTHERLCCWNAVNGPAGGCPRPSIR